MDTAYVDNIHALRAQAKWAADSAKIAVMNRRILDGHMYWRAGRTNLTGLFFAQKEKIFGPKNNLQGFDYMVGGIYQRLPHDFVPANPFITQSFDWRFRHDASDGTSPYFNSNGQGWLTNFSSQGSYGTCWAFSATALAEAYANLYFNNNTGPNALSHPEIKHQVDLNQSEMQLIACLNNGYYTCFSGGTDSPIVLNYMIGNLMYDSASFPYQCGQSYSCPTNWSGATDQIRNYEAASIGSNAVATIQESLIKYGPISCYLPVINHQMLLIGYELNNLGDIVYKGTGPNDPDIVLDSTCELIGTSRWVFKDSNTPNDIKYWYNISYVEALNSQFFLGQIERPLNETPIKCSDEDGDGYYWWGIHWAWNSLHTDIIPVSPQLCGCPPRG